MTRKLPHFLPPFQWLGLRHATSDRPTSGGGLSNIVGGAMLEMDKFARPLSV
jgi:hypothetical protein